MASLLLHLMNAFALLCCSVDSHIVKGIEFKKPEGYLRRNFTGRQSFDILASSTNGGNRTILTYSINDMAVIKLVHRSFHLYVEVFQNDSKEAICRVPYNDDSYFYFQLAWYFQTTHSVFFLFWSKGGYSSFCKKDFKDLDFQKDSTLFIGDPFFTNNSFEGVVAGVEYIQSDFPTFCFESLKENFGLQNQLEEWDNFDADFEKTSVPYIKLCKAIGRVAIINSHEINGFNQIQSEFCNLMYGRFLTEDEVQSIDQNITIWTQNSCEVIDFSKQIIKTCFPKQAYFACFIPKSDYKVQIFINYESGKILLEGVVQFIDELEEKTEYVGRYYLKGLSQPKFNITYRDGKWNLDFEGIKDGYELQSLLPFGKHSWQSKIEKRETHEIIIENCNGRFSCGDGTCYPHDGSCDGFRNCENGKDEEKCVNYKYFDDGEVCCSKETDKCEKYAYEVNYTASVIDIQDINSDDEKITIKMSFEFLWNEHRFTFRGKSRYAINVDLLPFVPSRQLILNEVESETNKEKVISNEYFWFDACKPISYFSRGDPVKIRNIFTVEFSFPCPFDFKEFPFGIQTFNISLSFGRCNSKYDLKLTSKQIELGFSKKQRGDFILNSLSDEVYHSGINILISLESHSSYYVLTSFTPTVFMCFIAYCTLYFKLSSFGERITVSATALLTLAVLFTEVNERIVKTPYPKLIDIWFIGCICYSAIIVLLNGFLHYLSWHLPLSWNLTGWFSWFRLNYLSRRSRSYSIETVTFHQDYSNSVRINLETEQTEDSSSTQQDINQQNNPSLPEPNADNSSTEEHMEKVINTTGRVVLLAAILVPLLYLNIAYKY